MKTIVYPDVLIIQNFFMNYLLLYLVNRLCSCRAKTWRIALGALIGAAYVVVVFFPDLKILYSLIMKVLVSVLMIVIAFFPYKFSRFLKLFIIFYLEAFILGGCIIAIIYLSNYNIQFTNNVFITGNSFIRNFIVMGSIIGIVLVKIGFDYLEGYYSGERNRVPLEIITNKGTSIIIALIDTGNSLKDPVTNAPVIIVYYKAVLDIFPDDIKKTAREGMSYHEIQKALMNSSYKSRVRAIPYKALGTNNGLLFGIRADRAVVRMKRKTYAVDNPIIALYENPLSSGGEYDGLIYPEIIRGRYKYDKIS
jgi:stage II sporulation protein GA (sporulation sigma-E factor processing peptidase)